MADVLQFVDSISATPTVLLDLNDGITWCDIEGTDFPPPPLREGVAQTLLANSAEIPASAYDRRTCRLRLVASANGCAGGTAGTADDVATAVQNLIRELDKPRNILRWQEDGMPAPVFFRTFRVSPTAVSTVDMPHALRRQIEVDVPADSEGLGLAETIVAAAILSTNPAAATNPTWIDIFAESILFTGASGAYASTPDTAVLDIVGDLDLRAHVQLADWTPASDVMLISKAQASGTSRSYALSVLTTGAIRVTWSTDGSTLTTKDSTVVTGFIDGTEHWVRATLDVNNGASGNDVKFWTSDDGVTWTQLGSTVTTAGITSIFAGDNALELGARSQGGSNQLTGRIFSAEVRNGIDGTIVTQPTATDGGLSDPVGGLPYTLTGTASFNAGVKGDTEAPAVINWPAGAVVAGRETVIAVRRRGSPGAAPWLFQAEAMTQGNDTTTQANDGAMSGSGNNWSRCTFGGVTGFAPRLSVTDVGIPGKDLRGRYKGFLRHKKTVSNDAISIREEWGGVTGARTTNLQFDSVNTVNMVMAYLGKMQIPRGFDPITGEDGAEISVSDAMSIAVQAARTSGTGNLDMDYLRLMPADDRYATITWVDPGPDHWLLNAEQNTATPYDSSGRVATAAAPRIDGGLPMLSPGKMHRIHILYETSASLANALTTITVSITYQPRYLSVRPATT